MRRRGRHVPPLELAPWHVAPSSAPDTTSALFILDALAPMSDERACRGRRRAHRPPASASAPTSESPPASSPPPAVDPPGATRDLLPVHLQARHLRRRLPPPRPGDRRLRAQPARIRPGREVAVARRRRSQRHLLLRRPGVGRAARPVPAAPRGQGSGARWYDGYRIVVSDIRATYGDGRLPARRAPPGFRRHPRPRWAAPS